MRGWKTRAGGGLLIIAGVLGYAATVLGYDSLTFDVAVSMVGAGFTALGLGHKFDKIRAVLEAQPAKKEKPTTDTGLLGSSLPIAAVTLTVVFGLAGCTAPRVSLPVGVASVMYANARADYATARVLIAHACKNGKLETATCEAIKQVDVRAQVYRANIEKALTNPEQEVDWAQVLQYSEAVAGLLLKLGLAP